MIGLLTRSGGAIIASLVAALAMMIAIGFLLVGAAAFNMYLLPYPLWFEILGLLILPLGAAWGVKIGRGPQSHHRGAAPEAEE